ncbi:hypothetical protein IAU60_005425 [Kwoniella sp. DSM 27419]
MVATTPRPKILGIGYPKYAIEEFRSLEERYDIHWFVPGDRKQVVAEVRRLCDEQGPFDAGYVWFTNTPTAVTNATADMACFLTLAALRGVYEGESNVRAGLWRNGMALTTDPKGLKLGIVGMADEEKALGVSYAPFEELIATSDVISLNCPLTPETRHLIDAEQFSRMKDGGAVIDEDALVEALRSGKVSRAGLDVFEQEPKIHPYLLASNRVTLQPHLGAMSTGTIHAGERTIFANLKAL